MTESTLKIISLVLSWPVAAVVIVLFLRKPIMKVVERFIGGQSGKAKIGPIEVELGQLADDGKKAIQQLNDINHIVARSRLIELEITMMTLSHAFSTKHQKDLEKVTLELKEKLNELDEK
ncbi:hypothetical protein [Oceanobacter antarcticus]|uniref:Phage shock protein B n=1 Tax=Oceanobacter antarcticus TaxID=3133425 RepID=A0ABW8NL19_9GAMM